MNRTAHITSIDVLRDFRAAFVKFGDDADAALCAIDMEVRRFIDWLEREQLDYWRRALRKRQEDLAQAKSDLTRRRISAMSGHKPDLSEQKKAVRVATERMREAEMKIENVKQWTRRVQEAQLRYDGQARQLAEMLESDCPKALARLDRMISSLDAYVSMSPVHSADQSEQISSAAVALAEVEKPDDAVNVDDWKRLRSRTPAADVRKVTLAEASDLDGAMTVDCSEAGEQLAASLGLPLQPAAPNDGVVFIEGCFDCSKVYFERRPAVSANDAGWFAGPVADGVLEERYVACSVESFLARHPAYEGVLSLPVGTLVVFSGKTIEAAFDADDRQVFDRAAKNLGEEAGP